MIEPIGVLPDASAPPVSGSPYFATRADHYERETAWLTDRPLAQAIIDRVPHLHPEDRAVDVAAGPGLLTRMLARERPARWNRLDLERAMLRRATPALAVHGDGAALPFRTGSMCVAVCRSGLHYIGAGRGLAELARVVAPDGKVVIAQKVADGLRDDYGWYAAVQTLRSVAPRQRYFSDDLLEFGDRVGLLDGAVAIHHQHQSVSLDAWSTRHGYFDAERSARLRELAQAGLDPAFRVRTGFTLEDDRIEFTLRWAIVTWTVADGVRVGAR